MNLKIRNQFLINYILMFFISTMIAVFAFILMDFANDIISKTLLKNNYRAEALMKDEYKTIDTADVVDSGGGIQVINDSHDIIFSKGLNTFTSNKLTVEEFTDFLMNTTSLGVPYSYDIEYNVKEQFWLVVTFPTSLRIDFSIVQNQEFPSQDMKTVVGVILAIILFYLILLALSTIIYSKVTSLSIVTPLKKLMNSAKRLRDGDYSARVNLNLENEFGELEDTFNAMAKQVEKEISLRKKAEENRKKLIMDISHDLKNPLTNIMGYAELIKNNKNLSREEWNTYSNIIYENSLSTNDLITDLFELSKLESSEFKINSTKTDICEFSRKIMGDYIPLLDNAAFSYKFNISDEEIIGMIDQQKMKRVFQNLVTNTIKYNPKGTTLILEIDEDNQNIFIVFKDNGIGIPKEIAKEIFKPFVRVNIARDSKSGGSGLGLSIVHKIIMAHGGEINLNTKENDGCTFIITLPKI